MATFYLIKRVGGAERALPLTVMFVVMAVAGCGEYMEEWG